MTPHKSHHTMPMSLALFLLSTECMVVGVSVLVAYTAFVVLVLDSGPNCCEMMDRFLVSLVDS